VKLSPRLPFILGAFTLGALLVGCGGKSDANLVKLKGKLVKGGQPYASQLTGPKYPEGEGVGMAEVTLFPVSDEKQVIVDDNGDTTVAGVQRAHVSPDGVFELPEPGSKSQGIPRGKYRVVVKHIDPLTDKDRLNGKYNEKNSKVTRDIGDGQEIVIDLAKPGG
jgi:hypothetical protein